MQQVGGSIIPHDSSPSALPPLLDKLLVLGLRQSFLNAVLSLLIQIPPQTFTCTPEVVSVAAPACQAGGRRRGTRAGVPVALLGEQAARGARARAAPVGAGHVATRGPRPHVGAGGCSGPRAAPVGKL